MEPVFALLVGIIAILAVFGIGIGWYCVSLNRKFNRLLENGNIKDFRQIFLSQKDKSAELEKQLKEAFARIKDLEAFSLKAVQKTAMVRFDPFNEGGGRQSFSIALLDKEDNGLVISSIFVHEGNRVYAKQVKKGASEILLSQEESEAVKKAMGSK